MRIGLYDINKSSYGKMRYEFPEIDLMKVYSYYKKYKNNIIELFQDYNGSFTYYNKHSGKYVPLIAIVINGFDVFSETFGKLSEDIQPLFRDGVKYGVVFIITCLSMKLFNPISLSAASRASLSIFANSGVAASS